MEGGGEGSGDSNIPAKRSTTCAWAVQPQVPGTEPYLDHLMFTLSPATTHSSLAVSPSGTVTVEGSPVIVSSPGPKEEALSGCC